jgi:hypothetical protein
MNQAIAFEVESTVETGGHAYVLARLLEPGTRFAIAPGATLGGYVLDECVDIPIASGAPGQRGDLFAFCLHSPSDRPHFVEGERVLLQPPSGMA